MKAPTRPSAGSYAIVLRGAAGAVRMEPSVHAEYLQAIAGTDEISMKRERHLRRYFQEFCEQKIPRLSDEKFKKEGNFPGGRPNTEVAIWTFKSWQLRIYGSTLAVANERCFVGVEIDLSKKQNKANKQKLESAARKIAALQEYRV
jgi:hypothetical protein